MHEDSFRAIEAGAAVVTASGRLARVLRQEFDFRQKADLRSVWRTPDILPFDAFLGRAWREWVFSGATADPPALLEPLQEQFVWEQVICDSPEGESLLRIPETAAQAARAMGVKVYTIAAGVRGEAPIPVTDAFGNKRLAMAQVDVDEDTLKKIAAETGGKFFRATDTESLKNIYAEIDRLEKTTHQLKKFEHHTELFAWAVVPALAVLGIGVGLGHTRFRRLP